MLSWLRKIAGSTPQSLRLENEMNTTNDFAVVIKQKLESDPEFARGVRKATFFADISQMVYDAHTLKRNYHRRIWQEWSVRSNLQSRGLKIQVMTDIPLALSTVSLSS